MHRTQLPAAIAAALLGGTLAAPSSGSASAELTAPATIDFVLSSFDGTPINAHFFPAGDLSAGGRAPVVLLAHGYGEAGPADRDGPRLAGAPRVKSLVDDGFNVLTWDARGMGASGGTARFDKPDVEVRDVRRLISWAARRPEVQLDGPGDPRVGMTGASYGGIIQYAVAARDRRVDAIAPGYTGWSLSGTTIAQNGKFKEGWALLLSAISAGTIPPGLTSPLGPQIHSIDPPLLGGVAGGVLTGKLSPAFRAYLDERSPSSILDRIHVPTLVTGGTSDTLFPLVNADRDYRALKARGVPVQMLWNCEGHSVCPGATGPLERRFDATQVRWFQRWLMRRRTVETGPAFTWIADNESRYRSSLAYPAPINGHLTGRGSGALALTPAGPLTSLSLPLLGAQPGTGGADVAISSPRRERDIVGFPTLTLTYAGTALPARTWVYAQVVDRNEKRVVNSQVTPIPLVLDGKEHTLRIRLNAISSRASETSRYQLQLLPGSLIYGQQHSAGLVWLSEITVRLPLR